MGGRAGGALADLIRLERLDIFLPVNDPAADLDVLRAFTRPTPPLQRAVRDVPASRQLDLIQMPDSHLVLLGLLSKTCGDDGCRAERKPTRSEREKQREICQRSKPQSPFSDFRYR